MIRLLSTLTAAGLLSAALGCCHYVAGVCDCACPGDPCCYGHGPGLPIDPCHYGSAALSYAPDVAAAPAPSVSGYLVTPNQIPGTVRTVPSGVTMGEPPVMAR